MHPPCCTISCTQVRSFWCFSGTQVHSFSQLFATLAPCFTPPAAAAPWSSAGVARASRSSGPGFGRRRGRWSARSHRRPAAAPGGRGGQRAKTPEMETFWAAKARICYGNEDMTEALPCWHRKVTMELTIELVGGHNQFGDCHEAGLEPCVFNGLMWGWCFLVEIGIFNTKTGELWRAHHLDRSKIVLGFEKIKETGFTIKAWPFNHKKWRWGVEFYLPNMVIQD